MLLAASIAWLALLAPPTPPPGPRSEDLPEVATTPPPRSAARGEPAAFYPPRREAARLAAASVVRPGLEFVPGRGLKISSQDRRFSLSLGVRTGFIYTNRRSHGQPPEHNLDVRRLRLLLQGNVFGAHNKYYVQLALAPRELDIRDGVVHASPVLDAYLRFDQLRDMNLTVGQYRVPFSRERNVSDVNPLLVDRSLVNAEFNLDRDIGVGLHSNDLGGLQRLRYHAGVFMGEGRDTDRFADAGLLYVARADFLPFGLFDDYESSDLTRSRSFRASIGGAYAFHDRARRDRGTHGELFADGGTASAHNVTADLALKWSGWSLDAAYHWRRSWRAAGDARDADGDAVPALAGRSGHGWMVQTALLIPRTRLEPALRHSQMRGLGDTSMPDRDELGGGLNYYFFGHDLKLQLDYFHTWTRGAFAAGDELLRLQIQVNL